MEFTRDPWGYGDGIAITFHLKKVLKVIRAYIQDQPDIDKSVRLISPVKISPWAGKTIVFQECGSSLNRSTLAVDGYNTFETTVIAYIYNVAIFVRFAVTLILVFHIRSV